MSDIVWGKNQDLIDELLLLINEASSDGTRYFADHGSEEEYYEQLEKQTILPLELMREPMSF